MNRVIAVICFIFPLSVFAQVNLKGTVRDHLNPIPGATIIITDQQGKMINSTITKDDGSFETIVKSANYKIRIGFIGYAYWEKDISLDKNTDLGIIILKEVTPSLKDVVIVGRKQIIEQKADRIVFHVENSIAATGGGATDALRAAPGLSIQNGTISMLGKGSSRILVNGRLIELTGQDLINYLNSISASDIKNIEIMSNPPAKYEALGDGGIININLKKGAANAWKSTTTLSYDQNKYAVYSLRNNFFYNKNKVKFSFNAGGKLGNLKTREDLDTYYPNGLWELNSTGKQKQDNLSGGFTFDYDVSPNTTIGAQYNGNYNNPDRKDNTIIKIGNQNQTLDSTLINIGLNDLRSANHAYNVHILTKLDTSGRKISFDADYFSYNSKIDNNFTATTYAPDLSFLNVNQSARNLSNQQINNLSIKVDMEHPLKFVNLSYGAKISFTNSNGNIQYYDTMSGNQLLDLNRSNNFNYKEDNQAIYLNGVKDFNSRLNMQIGLRLENTQTKGFSETLNQNNKNNYLKLFPTFYLTYKKNDNHTFLFNYGRRINRPGFEVLNPFRSYLNSKSYSEGNPFLQPSFNDNFEFTHVYKGKLRTNAFFNIVSNGFGVVFTANPENNTQVVSRQNYYKEYYYGLGETYSANLGSWWQIQTMAYLLGSNSKFTDALNSSPNNSPQVYLSTNNTFSIGKSTKFQIDYFYSSPFKRGLYTYGNMTGLNLAVKQNVLDNKLQLALLANDIFNTSYLKDYTSVVNGITQIYDQNNSNRYFRFSLTYSFGNSKINVKGRDFGNDDERKRTN
ncbi:outer membrane beta-barrel family protein [Pedobacter nototheniae]|uniref:outer membrane beta-barrel family protein n=1 Tax=Pedobacter nototheniae TaxID=2488994 RepID=UPI00292FA9DC|nr:outer membrane beta-barrel family protein [Pedobacter nototheniae]